MMIQTAVFVADEDVFFFGLNFGDLNRRNEFVEKEFFALTLSPTRSFLACLYVIQSSRDMNFYGAGRRTRTPGLLITNQLLYRLSYTSMLATDNSPDVGTVSVDD